MANHPSLWNLSLPTWAIGDGTYEDFTTGQTVEAAVEFYQERGAASEICQSEISATRIADNEYTVVADPLPCLDPIDLLDIGILVYRQRLPKMHDRLPEARFRTRLRIGVDAFSMWSCRTVNHDVLPMVYTWRIDSILRQTAPYIEAVYAGTTVLTRDAAKLGWEEITRTNALQDDNGLASYILRCELLNIPPKSTSATASV